MNVQAEIENVTERLLRVMAEESILAPEKMVQPDKPTFKVVDPNRPESTVKRLRNPEEIYRAVYESIQTDGDVNYARDRWNVRTLLRFNSKGDRDAACRALVKRFGDMEHAPVPLWQDMLDNPTFYLSWKREFESNTLQSVAPPTAADLR